MKIYKIVTVLFAAFAGITLANSSSAQSSPTPNTPLKDIADYVITASGTYSMKVFSKAWANPKTTTVTIQVVGVGGGGGGGPGGTYSNVQAFNTQDGGGGGAGALPRSTNLVVGKDDYLVVSIGAGGRPGLDGVPTFVRYQRFNKLVKLSDSLVLTCPGGAGATGPLGAKVELGNPGVGSGGNGGLRPFPIDAPTQWRDNPGPQPGQVGFTSLGNGGDAGPNNHINNPQSRAGGGGGGSIGSGGAGADANTVGIGNHGSFGGGGGGGKGDDDPGTGGQTGRGAEPGGPGGAGVVLVNIL